jgi:hypothetical protein
MPPRPRFKGPARLSGMLPDSIYVLAEAQSMDGHLSFGIVAIHGVLHAFTRSNRNYNGPRNATLHGTEVQLVPGGSFGYHAAIEAIYNGHRYECTRCTADDGLRRASKCEHCEAARLIDMYQWDHGEERTEAC